MTTSSKDVEFARRLEDGVDSLLYRITKLAKRAIDIKGDKERSDHVKIVEVARAIHSYKACNFTDGINIRELLKIVDEWRTHMDETLKNDPGRYATPLKSWSRQVLPKPIPELYMLFDLDIIECLIVITWAEVNSGNLVCELLKEPAEEVERLLTRSTTSVHKRIEVIFERFHTISLFSRVIHYMDRAARDVLSGDDLSQVAQLVDLTHQLNDFVTKSIDSDLDYRNLLVPKVNIPFKRQLTLHTLPRPYSPLFGTSKSSDHDNDDTEPIVRKELTQTHIEEIER